MKTFSQFQQELNESAVGWVLKTAKERAQKNKILASPKLQARAKVEVERRKSLSAIRRKKAEAAKGFKKRFQERHKFKHIQKLRSSLSNKLNIHKRITSAIKSRGRNIASKAINKTVDIFTKNT